jgi:hypothetical protein
MATITRRLFVRHLSTTPTMHVTHFRRGGIRHAGAGQAFWFRPWMPRSARCRSTTASCRSS